MRHASRERFNPLRQTYRSLRRKNRKIKEEKSTLEKEIEYMSLLYEFSREVASNLSLDEIIHVAARTVSRVLNLKNIAIFLWDFGKKEFRKIYEEGFMAIPNIIDFKGDRKRAVVLEVPGGYNLFLPLLIEKKLTGWIISRDRTNTFSGILEEGTILADQIALGVEKARLYQEVEEMSRTDGLTRLYRRHYFISRLEQEVLRARRYRTRFSMVMIDVDHFKQYNDTYGHPVGDELLRNLAAIIKNNVYETDLVARYGGEEFALLMPLISAQEVYKKAEKIRRIVAEHNFQIGEEKIKLNISMGISHFPSQARQPDLLIQYADQALYQAKQQGRNRVVEYSS